YDKGLDFDQLGEVMAQRAKAVITMGATARKILAAVQRHSTGRSPSSTEVKDLSEAISQARKLTESGDVVVLSPACASYGTFKNYEERGQLFVRLVNQYARGSRT
ncbi:MAG: UDP-N-acetylmuramoyl-L-alanine--D-glutamate ligase, partial [Phycisphaerae bacterium]|nr:UDP-N-acetylmuramoyl-L-alanine--D-glutamate ligase [Phycisphaerae bacterium]